MTIDGLKTQTRDLATSRDYSSITFCMHLCFNTASQWKTLELGNTGLLVIAVLPNAKKMIFMKDAGASSRQALANMLKLVTPKATKSQAFGAQATQWSKTICLPSLTLPSSRLTAMSEIGYIMSLVEDAADLGIQTAFKPSTHSKKDLKFKVVAVVECYH